MNVVIAAGGTAGHVVPALAVADALRADGVEVAFVGGARAEAELVPAAGYPLHRVDVEGLSRRNPLRALRALRKAWRAYRHSLELLGRLAPDAVLGGGGYVAGPVGAAAARLRIPLVLTEADSHLGLANRLLAPFARRVCLAFPPNGRGRRGSRYLVTGRPIPPPWGDREDARAQLGIADDDACVLIFGGSLGARSINEAAVAAFADAPFHVIHVSGHRDYDDLAARAHGPRYVLRPYVEPFAPVLAAADLVVARAGGSIFEVVAHGCPAVLIPYPHATADHQSSNARWMADAGAAVVIPDDEVSAARLGGEVGALVADRARLDVMARASAGLARPRAAADVAAALREAAGG